MKIQSVIPLKPCPFCGSKAMMWTMEHGDCYTEIGFGAGCPNPNCWAYLDSDICWYTSNEDAAKVWNNRPI